MDQAHPTRISVKILLIKNHDLIPNKKLITLVQGTKHVDEIPDGCKRDGTEERNSDVRNAASDRTTTITLFQRERLHLYQEKDGGMSVLCGDVGCWALGGGGGG